MGYRPVWLGLRRGVFTCVGWKVTLCDPIWQVTLRSCVMELSINGLQYLYLFTFYRYGREASGDIERLTHSASFMLKYYT